MLTTILCVVLNEKQYRRRCEPVKLYDYNLSYRKRVESENDILNPIEYCRRTVYLRIIDKIININLEKRFSDERLYYIFY